MVHNYIANRKPSTTRDLNMDTQVCKNRQNHLPHISHNCLTLHHFSALFCCTLPDALPLILRLGFGKTWEPSPSPCYGHVREISFNGKHKIVIASSITHKPCLSSSSLLTTLMQTLSHGRDGPECEGCSRSCLS